MPINAEDQGNQVCILLWIKTSWTIQRHLCLRIAEQCRNGPTGPAQLKIGTSERGATDESTIKARTVALHALAVVYRPDSIHLDLRERRLRQHIRSRLSGAIT